MLLKDIISTSGLELQDTLDTLSSLQDQGIIEYVSGSDGISVALSKHADAMLSFAESTGQYEFGSGRYQPPEDDRKQHWQLRHIDGFRRPIRMIEAAMRKNDDDLAWCHADAFKKMKPIDQEIYSLYAQGESQYGIANILSSDAKAVDRTYIQSRLNRIERYRKTGVYRAGNKSSSKRSKRSKKARELNLKSSK